MSTLIPKLDKFNSIFAEFLKDYDVHFCRVEEIEDVVFFLDAYWKKGHVLVESRKLMDWQHFDKANNRYNFVLARSKNSNEIHALLGFIPSNHFDSNITKLYVWGAIWKIREDVTPAGLGVYLWQYTTEMLDIETWVSFGISEDAKKNYKLLGFSIGNTDNYFFANPTIKEFNIAAGLEKYQKNDLRDADGWSLTKLEFADYEKLSENDVAFESVKSYKSKLYYENRYLKHPFYKYECYAVKQGDEIKSHFFVRESPANDSNCLRLIEYVGDYTVLQNVQGSIANLLEGKKCEYMDIITSNTSDELMQNANFINKAIDSSIVIPNYFEPFVQKNVPMEYAYISLDKNYKCIINKGDADQDRPSSVED